MWLMTFTSFFTLLPVFYFILPDWRLPASAVPYLAVSAVAEALYFISLGRAYELGDHVPRGLHPRRPGLSREKQVD